MRVSARARRNAEGSERSDVADRSEAARRTRGRTAGPATVVTKRPTARMLRPSRPLQGRVGAGPPSANGETMAMPR